MDTSKNLDINRVLCILDERVLQNAGRYLTEAEKAVIEGSWNNKDYKEIASTYGYSSYYLQQEVGPQLWTTLSKVFGNGVQIKKINLKNILQKAVKEDYIKQEVSKLDENSLVGKTKIYGELPKTGLFYGRQKDIKDLKRKITISRKQCIALIGTGGIGKSILAAKVIEELLSEQPDSYEYIVWKIVERYSSIEDIVTELINIFGLVIDDKSLQGKIYLLTKHIRQHSCLIVLDSFEKAAQIETFEKRLEYEDFFAAITNVKCNSCILVTSQIPLKDIVYVTTSLPIESLKIEGLDQNAAMQMLHDRGLYGEECKKLIENYRANPSELETVAERINRIFKGNVQKFFEYQTTVIGSRLRAMLNLQFGQAGLLSNLQKQIMIYLAEEIAKDSNSIPFSKLVEGLKERFGSSKLQVSEIITAVEVLEDRSLIETDRNNSKHEVSYTLEPVIKKYILVDALGLVYKKSPSQLKTDDYIQEPM